jgi:hypothetical protein
MVTTRGTEDKVFESKFIKPGIHENVKIEAITAPPVEDGKSPYIQFKFVDLEGKAAEINFYMSDAAMPMSLRKIKHIATKLVEESVIDGVEAPSIPAYAKAISPLLCNKMLRVKFVGKEIQGKEGKQNWFKAALGLPAFAESMGTTPTKLVFTETSQWDMERLPVIPEAPVGVDASSPDLPF